MSERGAKFELPEEWRGPSKLALAPITTLAGVVLLLISAWIFYVSFRLEVPPRKVAVLLTKTGLDLPANVELAPDDKHKGVQLNVVKEGRVFLNPYYYNWKIHDQVEVPDGKVGVLIRLFGEDLPHGELLAMAENQKGIVPGALRPGRYPDYSNPFAYQIQTFDAVTVPAGSKGVVTLVTGQMPKKANQTLVEPGERGVQKAALEAGTYYVNPYERRISIVDCRTKMVDLSEEQDMGFPSRDGFWIRLDGTVQFHVIPEKAPEVFVIYNDDDNGDELYEEIVRKVILPNSRSFCRLAGSGYSGRQFIEGKGRGEFQKTFQTKLTEECEPHGIKIVSALITKVFPPQLIAAPVRGREIAKQKQAQYTQEMEQQKSEAKLVIEKMKVEQKKKLVEAEREVIQMKTKAKEQQKVAMTKAEQELAVAKTKFEAAKDLAAAKMARGKAQADVIRLNNEAEVAGLRASVKAFNNSGFLFAQQVLYTKLAPAYKQIMANTSNSPIMDIFAKYQNATAAPSVGNAATDGAKPAATAAKTAIAPATKSGVTVGGTP